MAKENVSFEVDGKTPWTSKEALEGERKSRYEVSTHQ